MHKINLTAAAAANLSEVGMGAIDVTNDVESLANGQRTAEQLLEDCIDGADEDRVQGWRDYVDAVEAAAARYSV